jgi:hypothetical protein
MVIDDRLAEVIKTAVAEDVDSKTSSPVIRLTFLVRTKV